MVKLYEFDETALFAWSNDTLPLIASGTLSGVMDDTFSSESTLSIYEPFNPESKGPLYQAKAHSKFNSIAWGQPMDSYHHGILAGGLEDTTIQLWDAEKILQNKPTDLDGARIAQYKKHTTAVLQVKFNPLQNHILASSGSKGEIFIWDTKKGSSFSPGQAISPMTKVSSLAWNNSMSHIFGSAGDNGYTSIWDLKAKREVLQLNYAGVNLSVLQWHPNQSTKLVTASDSDTDPIILTWDLRNSSAPEKILKGHTKGILSLDWCKQDPTFLLSSGKDDSTLLWNPIEGYQIGSYPSLPNWVQETKFAPNLPDVFASASLSKKVVIQTLQDTSEPISNQVQSKNEDDFWNEISTTETQRPIFTVNQAPNWLQRPISATFGFGGKLVIAKKDPDSKTSNIKIVNISKDGSLDKSAKDLITAIAQQDFKKICDSKLEAQNSLSEGQDWQLLKDLLENGKTKQLMQKLPQIKPQAVKEDDGKDNDSENSNEDDFFAQLGSAKQVESKTKYTPIGAFNLFDDSNEDEFEKETIHLILNNKFDDALDLCISKNRIMEGLVLSLNGTPEMKNKAKGAYFAKYAKTSPLSRLLYSASTDDISDVVKNADISSWQDIANAIISFSSNKKFFNSELCLLGDRLLESDLQDSRNNAVSCYIAAGALDKVSKVWLSELRDYENFFLANKDSEGKSNSAFEARFKALGEIIEKTIVFESAISNTASENLEGLGKTFQEYADYLANFGHFELAYKLLEKIPDSIPGIKLEKERISKAFIKTAVNDMNSSNGSAYTRSGFVAPGTFKKSPYNIPPTNIIPVTQGASMSSPKIQASSTGPRRPSQNPYAPPAASNPYSIPQTGSSIANQQQLPLLPTQQQKPLPTSSLAPGYQQTFPPAVAKTGSFPPPAPKFNPYAPKTALDSLKGQSPHSDSNAGLSSIPLPPTIKDFVPPSMKKEVGGWNDLPVNLAPVPKTTVPSVPNAFKVSSTPAIIRPPSRNVSQPMAMPPPPKSMKSGSQLGNNMQSPTSSRPPSRYASMTSPQTGQSRNPYAPKPEPNAPVRVPIPQPNISQSSTPIQETMPKVRNPYAPRQSVVDNTIAAPSPPGNFAQNNGFNNQTYPPQPPQSGFTPNVNSSIPPPPPKIANSFTAPPKTPAMQSQPSMPEQSNEIPSGDSSHISAAAKPIFEILTSELEKVKPNIPEKFNKQLVDAEKRLNILFDHLNRQDLLTGATVQALVELSTALAERDFAKASTLQSEISTEHSDECGQWMVGLKRLIGMVEATNR